MKKFIPYLLFSATTLHTVLGVLPVMAIGCSSNSDKADVVCEEGDTDCQEKISTSTIKSNDV
tara:strand:+ start:128 stop:313 length:186 start_codon:yes stop_codon:yes gene_type:complete